MMKAHPQLAQLEELGQTSRPLVANLDATLQPLYRLAVQCAAPLARVSLASIFLWIGIGKFIDPTAVVGLIHASIFRAFAAPAFVYFLGTLELIAGIFLVLGMGLRYVALLALGLFASTLAIFLTTPTLVFAGHGILLSLLGQFLLKDSGLAALSVLILAMDVATNKLATK